MRRFASGRVYGSLTLSKRAPRLLLGLGVGAAVAVVTEAAQAESQFTVGLLPGVAFVREAGRSGFSGAHFFGGVSGEWLLLRQRESDFGLGPSVGAYTVGFDDLRLGLGISGLAPTWASFPLVVRLEALLQRGGGVNSGGFGATAFWGWRGYNHHAAYSIAVGPFVGAQQLWGPQAGLAVVGGVQIDGLLALLPLVAGYEAVAH